MDRAFCSTRAIRAGLCAVALVVIGASAALAQGFYYKEIRKDDRIYVFNVGANAERFEKTGEMGIGITKPGVGPAGETVVGDNERALQLFFFKHGIAEVVADPQAPVQTMVWRDGKMRITTDSAYLEMSSRVQTRFTFEDPNSAVTLSGSDLGPGGERGSFRIRRAKFKLEGWIIRTWLTYETQLNFPGAASNSGRSLLEDAAFDVDFSKGRGLFRVHLGQFKPPYGAQEMTSSGSQTFVDRALVSNNFFRGRETGVALWGATPNNRFEWRIGVFNGNGVTQNTNDNDKMQVNARLMWQPNGSQVLNQRAWVTGALYSESDFESTTAPIYAIAINYDSLNNFKATTGNDTKTQAASVDGIFKYKGFMVNGMFARGNRTPETGAELRLEGGFIQIAKLFSRRRFEVAIRYGTFDPSNLASNNKAEETRVAFSYYYARHGLKWQNDVGQVQVQNGANPTGKTVELRSQFQFIF
jgi:hypothetical protein